MNNGAAPAEVRERLAGVIADAMAGWADNLADALIASTGAATPTSPAPPEPEATPGTAVLWEALQILAWLHAELAHKHTLLVAEINGMVQQALGPAGAMDAQRLQDFRQRAVRIARFRNTQNGTTTATPPTQ